MSSNGLLLVDLIVSIELLEALTKFRHAAGQIVQRTVARCGYKTRHHIKSYVEVLDLVVYRTTP